jgi:small nuclear ribonucleoprotein (snRNP)-like protein
MDNPTHQKVVAQAPWHVQLWFLDVDCVFNDQAPTKTHDEPTSVRVPLDDTEEIIATLQQFSSKAAALLTDLTEARPLIRTKLIVKTRDGGQLISVLVNCVATLDFVS